MFSCMLEGPVADLLHPKDVLLPSPILLLSVLPSQPFPLLNSLSGFNTFIYLLLGPESA